jgi:hypothetical protein
MLDATLCALMHGAEARPFVSVQHAGMRPAVTCVRVWRASVRVTCGCVHVHVHVACVYVHVLTDVCVQA